MDNRREKPQKGYDLEKILEGDDREWVRVFDCFRYLLQRTAYGLGYRGQEAEDLLADAFFHVYNRFGKFDHRRKEKFAGFVKTVGCHYIIDQWRKDQRRMRREARAAREAPDKTENPALKALEVDEVLQAFLARLTPRLREVFRLRAAGYTNPEIAAMLEMNVSAVSTAYSRARAQLKDFLKEFG